jgi:hypothetical protein
LLSSRGHNTFDSSQLSILFTKMLGLNLLVQIKMFIE